MPLLPISRRTAREPLLRAFLPLALLIGVALGFPATVRAEFTLVSTQPAHGAQDAPAHGPFLFTFSSPVKLSSFVLAGAAPTLQLTPATGAGGLPITWSLTLSEDRRTVVARPSLPLDVTRGYRLYLSRKGDVYPVKQDDAASTPLSTNGAPNPLVFHVVDTLPPEVDPTTHSPMDGLADAPVNALVQFRASEPLDPATLRLTLNGALLSPAPDATGLRWRTAPALAPNTAYTVALSGSDLSGNALPPQSWAFSTRSTDTPDTTPPTLVATSPAPDATGVALTVHPSVTFSERVAPLSVVPTFSVCGGKPFPDVGWTLSVDGELTLVTPALPPGPTCYDVRVIAEDWAGNPLSAAPPYHHGFRFTTADAAGPLLLAVEPPPNAHVHPITGPDLTLRFSEDVKSSGADAPILRLEYASGAPPPRLDPRDATDLGAGRWRLEGAGWASPRDVTARVLPDANGFRYFPGDTLFLQLVSAADLAGNPLAPGSVVNPWTVSIVETRPSELLGVTPAEDALVALDAPVIARFSRAMDPYNLRFEAEGDWSISATELLTAANRPYSPRRWVANSPAWNANRTVVTLRHTPFEVSPAGQTSAHALTILLANDAQRTPSILGVGQAWTRMWRTSSPPRLPGDFDGSGVFEAKDVTLALAAFAERRALSPEELSAVDLAPAGGDGRFDATDVNALLRLYRAAP